MDNCTHYCNTHTVCRIYTKNMKQYKNWPIHFMIAWILDNITLKVHKEYNKVGKPKQKKKQRLRYPDFLFFTWNSKNIPSHMVHLTADKKPSAVFRTATKWTLWWLCFFNYCSQSQESLSQLLQHFLCSNINCNINYSDKSICWWRSCETTGSSRTAS